MPEEINHKSAANFLLNAQKRTNDPSAASKNAQIVNEAISRFNEKAVWKVPHVKISDSAFADAKTHPPHLTANERRRFTRTYYLFWALMLSPDEASRQKQLQELPLKTLYLLMEVAMLDGSIGDLETAELSTDSTFRGRLRDEIWDEINRKFRMLFDADAISMIGLSNQNGPSYGFLVLFDYAQAMFKEVCHGGNSKSTPEIRRLSWLESDSESSA